MPARELVFGDLQEHLGRPDLSLAVLQRQMLKWDWASAKWEMTGDSSSPAKWEKRRESFVRASTLRAAEAEAR
jgi:hypothetical protein